MLDATRSVKPKGIVRAKERLKPKLCMRHTGPEMAPTFL